MLAGSSESHQRSQLVSPGWRTQWRSPSLSLHYRGWLSAPLPRNILCCWLVVLLVVLVLVTWYVDCGIITLRLRLSAGLRPSPARPTPRATTANTTRVHHYHQHYHHHHHHHHSNNTRLLYRLSVLHLK